MLNIQGLNLSADYGNLIKGVAAAYAEVYDETMKQIKPVTDRFFNVKKSNAALDSFGKTSGVDTLAQFGEGQKIPNANVYLGEDAIFRFKNYGRIVEVTRNAIEDNAWKNEMDMMKKLAKASDATKEKAAFAVLNGAFSTATTYNGFPISRPESGEALLSSAHALANGGTASNVLTDSAPLSPASVAALERLILETPSENGEPLDYSEGLMLVVPTALRDLALRITESIQLQGTANNDTNSLRGIEVLATPYMAAAFGGSDTAYFLVAKNNNGLVKAIRQEARLEQAVDFETKNLKNSVDIRIATGFTDWRGVAGSRGNSVAYAG